MTITTDSVFDDLQETMELLRHHSESQETLIESLMTKNSNLCHDLERHPRMGWLDIAAFAFVAFAYGAWFGAIQCPK